MQVNAIIREARQHVGDTPAMESSARLCLADAVQLYDRGDYTRAREQAVRSLRYSVGVFSPIYLKVGGLSA